MLNNNKQFHSFELSLSNFLIVLVDSYYVRDFSIDQDVEDLQEPSIITIYKTKSKTVDLLKKLGIDMIDAKIIDETTIRLDPDQLEILKEKAPFL